MTRPKTLVLSLLLAAALTPVLAQTPRSVLEEAYLMGIGENVSLYIDMIINTNTGDKSRQLEIFMRQDSGGTKILAQIVNPTFLKNMKFLQHRPTDGRDSTWLKTSRGVRRLSSNSTSERLFDSDFTVEDFSPITTEDFQVSFLPEDANPLPECFAVAAQPLKSDRNYSEKVYYIDRTESILKRVDYYDADGDLVKRYELLEIQEANGRAYPLRSTMEDLSRNTSTQLLFTTVDEDTALPSRIFNKGSL